MTLGGLSNMVDLRRWGYAPGNYSFRCVDCSTQEFKDWPVGAKHSWRCEKHAREAMNSWVDATKNDPSNIIFQDDGEDTRPA